MSRVSVETSKPKRLVRHNGRWILEIECLVALPDNILRPTIERIEGDDVILYHLESSPAGQVLATAASRLLRSFTDPNDERAFEIRHGAWVPAMVGDFHEDPKAISKKLRQQDVGSARTGEVGMRTEMATMAVAFERLSRRLTETERRQMEGELPQEIALRINELETENITLRTKVGDLEAQVRVLLDAGHEDTREAASRAVANRAGRPGGALPPRADAGAPALGSAQDDGPTATVGENAVIPEATKRREAAPAAGPPKAVAEAPPPAGSPGVKEDPKEEVDEVPEPEAIVTDKPLWFPPAPEMEKAAKTLLGPQVTLVEKEFGPRFNKRGAEPFYMCRLIDDADVEVGAMVADLRTTISFGGKLMMIPSDELATMIESKTPSEDIISAMSEVFNTLSSCINSMPDGTHVRVTPLEQLDVQTVPWTVKCGHRVNFVDNDGGVIALVARNAPTPAS